MVKAAVRSRGATASPGARNAMVDTRHSHRGEDTPTAMEQMDSSRAGGIPVPKNSIRGQPEDLLGQNRASVI